MHTPYRLLLVSPLFLALAGCGSVEVIDTLSGTVVDFNDGPVAGVRVAIDGKTVVTGADGRFSFSQVTGPYDVTLLPEGSSDPRIFIGLTGEQPTLKITDLWSGAPKDLHGGSVALDLPISGDETESASFFVERIDEMAPVEVPFATPTAPGQIPILVQWHGSGGAKVRIQAFRYTTGADGQPKHYTGHATTELALEDGAQLSWKASWQTPTFKEKKVSLSIDLPSGYEIFQSKVQVRLHGAAHGQTLAWSTGVATDLSFVVPDLPGPIFDVEVCAFDGYSASCRTQPGLVAGADSTSIEVEEGPRLALESVTLGVGSEVVWSAGGDGAGFVLFHPTDLGGPAPSYFIATADESVTIPDLAALGVTLPRGADYKVAAFRMGAADTVDEIAKHGTIWKPAGEGSTYAYTPEAPVKTP